MNKFELLRQAVQTYKVNHCDGDKNEKILLDFIDELEQLTIPVVVGTLPCDECDDGKVWSPYYAKYVDCDCRK